jgi:peptide/nickel transport system ATP-binding protein
MPDLINVSGLGVEYSSGEKARTIAVDNVSLRIPSKSYTLGIVGESGSGKTTLGMSIMNLIERPGRITSGSVAYNGTDVLTMDRETLRRYRWREVAMVFQSAMNSLNPVLPISSQIVEVIREHDDVSKSEAEERTAKLMTGVGIKADRIDGYPHEFSGGMRQRAVIAMALALSPKLLIADEPTSALDVVVQKQILALVKKEVIQNNLSLLFITHEIALLNGLVDNVAVMFAGEIAELGLVKKVLFEPLHPYTKMLLGSMLSLDMDERPAAGSEALLRLSEKVPGVGCKYSNRCKYAFDRCRTERPQLREAEPDRWVACHLY